MMYFEECLSSQSVGEEISSDDDSSEEGLCESEEHSEHINFQIARDLEQTKNRLVNGLCQLPAVAQWLIQHYEQEGERSKNDLSDCLENIKNHYNVFKQQPECSTNKLSLINALQTFPFTFEDINQLTDLITHAFQARNLNNPQTTNCRKQCKPNRGMCIISEQESETCQLLSDEELLNCFNEVNKAKQAWLEARQALATANSKLVLFIANQYRSGFLDFDDLVQEGQTGLLKAVDRFNPHLGFQFSTYASYWIRKAISRALSRCERVVRVPCGQIANINKVFRAKEELTLKLGREANMQELADYTQLTREEIYHILAIAQTASSLENFDEDEEESAFAPIDFLEQHIFTPAFSEIAKSHLENLLTEAIKTLNPREAKIICSHFGVDNDEEMTLQEIGAELNLTRERVRQIQVMALNKMKHCYGEQLSSFL